jgi:diketogulonate reductase-like aldo/keto reductase
MPLHYNEAGVGDALRLLDAQNDGKILGAANRSTAKSRLLFIQSKFTPNQDAPQQYDTKAPIECQVEQSFAQSLRNLGLDGDDAPPLDSYLLHSAYADLNDSLRAWSAMERLYAAGRVRQLGISNFYDANYLASFLDAVRVKPALLQNNLHESTHYNQPVLPLLRQHNIVLQTFWTISGNRAAIDTPQIIEVARNHNATREF